MLSIYAPYSFIILLFLEYCNIFATFLQYFCLFCVDFVIRFRINFKQITFYIGHFYKLCEYK